MSEQSQQPQAFDLVVIGAGPGGYAAAIRASQRGLAVALVEKQGAHQLGGTCLNVGCIPTKFLLERAKTWHHLQTITSRGFTATELAYDWPQILAGKNRLIERQRQGLGYLMKIYNITVIQGHGAFHPTATDKPALTSSGYTIAITKSAPTEPPPSATPTLITAGAAVIATGSTIKPLPAATAAGAMIYNSNEILDIPAIPKHLAIIGGGVIGTEFASLFAMMGAKVTLIEAGAQLLSEFDEDCVAELIRGWRKFKVRPTILTATVLDQLTPRTSSSGHDTLHLSSDAGGNSTIKVDATLIAVGRSPATAQLGLHHLGIKLDAHGGIPVDEFGQTTAAGVYAIGDVRPGPALAHTATAEAHQAIDHLTTQDNPPTPINYNNNPGAVYSYPELAAVGLTTAKLKELKIPFSTAVVPFNIMAKATIEGYPEGFVKIHTHQHSSEILGVHIVGGRATELISEFVLAKCLESTLTELAHAIRPHPTLTEIISEIAHMGLSEPVHAPPPPQAAPPA